MPIEAHYDFREALNRAVESYRCRKIAEYLPYAFQKYEQMRQMGFKLGAEDEKKHFKLYKDLAEKWKETVRKGREANGEPIDFNF